MRNRLVLEWLLVAGLAVATVCLLIFYQLTQRPDNLAYDALARMRPPLSSNVLIVAIDEGSLGSVGPWPWPRGVHARLIDKIEAARPKAIGYDVLFVEPSAEDERLAAAVRRAGDVVLPLAFSVPGLNGTPFDIQAPVPPLQMAARALGHVNLASDEDGIVRRASLIAGNRSDARASFAKTLHDVAKGDDTAAFVRSARPTLPETGFVLAQQLLIPFSGPAGFHRTISAEAVLRDEVPSEVFRDRIVLVGSTASGSGDQYPVPTGRMPGVELLANVADALVENRAIRPIGRSGALAAALGPLFVLLGALLAFPPRVNILLGLAMMVSVVAISGGLLIWTDIWLPPTAALVGLLIVYPLWAWRRLEAASAYMVAELTRLRGEPDLLPMRVQPPGSGRGMPEAIARQATLLHMAIGRVRDLRRFFADSLHALPDPTLVTGADGRVLVANRAAEALFGASTGESLDALLRRIEAPAAEGAIEGTSDLVSADGRTFVLATAPLNDAQGERAGSIARLTDITQIRLAARQREEALQLLTHDMRSPQASILALLEQTDADAGGVRNRIAAYAQRTLKLADDFVHYARAQAGQPANELLDFGAILIEAADDQWALASAKAISVETPEPEEEYLVYGDRSLLSRMLCNLIGNAIKYSDPGTIVRCTLERENGTARCRIADQGVGIAPEDQETIFHPFRRSREAAGSGAGLGLAFVRAVVQRHRGTIEVESVPGAGTTFTVRVPLAPEDQPDLAAR